MKILVRGGVGVSRICVIAADNLSERNCQVKENVSFNDMSAVEPLWSLSGTYVEPLLSRILRGACVEPVWSLCGPITIEIN